MAVRGSERSQESRSRERRKGSSPVSILAVPPFSCHSPLLTEADVGV